MEAVQGEAANNEKQKQWDGKVSLNECVCVRSTNRRKVLAETEVRGGCATAVHRFRSSSHRRQRSSREEARNKKKSEKEEGVMEAGDEACWHCMQN